MAIGETKLVELDVRVSDLAFYDEKIKDWKAESGKFILQMGNSSRNISQTATIEVR
ncbi:fibronectin type III-like domain-contianing protein [Niabella sp.]|uniref:fibronectin type III-like domain-contianing protein n=1 Tax=Niabella sp. TaxID=1962976 RepID=UPI0026108E2A|nr:fibronectin type III-like domain-contianing protein [Niabella sp.]